MALKEPNSIVGIDRNSVKVFSINVIFGIWLFSKSLGSALTIGVPGNNEPRILNASIVSFFQQFGLSAHIHYINNKMYLFITSIYVIYIVLFLKLTSQEGHDDDDVVVLDKIALRSCSPVKSDAKVTEL